MNRRDYAFEPHGPQAVRKLPWWVGLAGALALVGLLVLTAQEAPVETACTEAEVAAYEAHGWDAYECDGDKAALIEQTNEYCPDPDDEHAADAFDPEFLNACEARARR